MVTPGASALTRKSEIALSAGLWRASGHHDEEIRAVRAVHEGLHAVQHEVLLLPVPRRLRRDARGVQPQVRLRECQRGARLARDDLRQELLPLPLGASELNRRAREDHRGQEGGGAPPHLLQDDHEIHHAEPEAP
jgi:hypothetical protein